MNQRTEVVTTLKIKPRVNSLIINPGQIPPDMMNQIRACNRGMLPRSKAISVPDNLKFDIRGKELSPEGKINDLMSALQIDLTNSEVTSVAHTIQELKEKGVKAVLWIPEGKYYRDKGHQSLSLEIHDIKALEITGATRVVPGGIYYEGEKEFPILQTTHDPSIMRSEYLLLKGKDVPGEASDTAHRIDNTVGKT